METKLWYEKPASQWNEGLPIGNGRLAAMVLGQHARERIALNHEWLWTGKNRERDVDDMSSHLPEVRDLLLSQDYETGTIRGNDFFGGKGGISPEAGRVDPYQPAGDLYIELVHASVFDYRRELDLASAITEVRYQTFTPPKGTDCITRTSLVHFTRDLVLTRVVSGKKPLCGAVHLDRISLPNCELRFQGDGNTLAMSGQYPSGIRFTAICRVYLDEGELEIRDGRKIVFTNARNVLIAANVGVNANGHDPETESIVPNLDPASWDEIVREHVEEYRKHYASMCLTFGKPESNQSTDKRLAAAVASGSPGSDLAELYFNYGRYLLCSSSARGELPANLQGKWNEDPNPSWDCDYHHDINLQMCYWLANPTGLGQYNDALFQHIERHVAHGREVARKLYGCEGIVLPLQTDPWGRCTPESYGWAVWIGAAAWLAQHFWRHYEYTLDTTFLRDRAYPFLREVAAFYQSYLVEDESGTLQIVPSQSPENRFEGSGRLPVSLCVSAAMDVELARECLTHAGRAAEILDVDSADRAQWDTMIGKLPKPQIGSKGQMLEWNQEFVEFEPGHRHISHLYGLFPGDSITPEGTPDLFSAARRSLELRIEAQNAKARGSDSGWALSWHACCFARLGDGERVREAFAKMLTKYTTCTLLDLHPPRVFQIDGNIGMPMAILESLFQSYGGTMRFLPALPNDWPDGELSGIRAVGGFTVDFTWRNRQVEEAVVRPAASGPCRFKGIPFPVVRDGDDAVPTLTDASGVTVFSAVPNHIYRIFSETGNCSPI